jgi:hypothetical protein
MIERTLTKAGLVPARALDKWLRWEGCVWLLNADQRASTESPNDAALKREIERRHRQIDRMKLPDGFSSWEALEARLIETGQFRPMRGAISAIKGATS